METVVASIPIKETVFLPIYYQPTSSITIDRVSQIEESGSSWLTLILRYLSTRELSSNRTEAHKVQVQATRFSLVNGQLYKRSLDGQYLKCLTTQQRQYLLVELHEGVCENHLGDRTLAHKAHMQGYYWPTMRAHATAYVKKCDHCQWQAHLSRVPAQDLASITSPWPFAQWGIDIVGPLPTAPA